MRRIAIALLVLFFAVSAWAQAKPAGAPAKPEAPALAPLAPTLPTAETVDSFLKHMFGYDPNIQWKIFTIRPSLAPNVAEVIVGVRNQQQAQEPMQPMQFYVMPDGAWAAVGELMPFGADPFAANNDAFATRAHGPARGPADAPVTMIEFSDLECPACKAAHPTIEKLLSDFPNYRFIFQNYPLEQIHPWAMKAAKYADCVARDNGDAFWKFIKTDYENQESVTPDNADQKLKEFAAQSGANADKVVACAAVPGTEDRVRDSLALGKTVDVNATPTLFVNGRRIQNFAGIPYDTLKQLVSGTPK